MSILVDTSIWVEYLRAGSFSDKLDFFIDENLVVTNDLILAELIPFLKVRNQKKLIALLRRIRKVEVHIDWQQIIDFQCDCLKMGINGVGIPDLIIAQNARQHDCAIFTQDRHFLLMKDRLNFKILQNP